jgi:hypothetical protein
MYDRKFSNVFIAGFVAAVTAACGGGAVPAQELASAKSATRTAEEIGAKQQPQSALHLKLAQDQIAEAERLIEDGDNDKAKLVLEQARADAELSLALTRELNERRAAEQALMKVESLKSQAQ